MAAHPKRPKLPGVVWFSVESTSRGVVQSQFNTLQMKFFHSMLEGPSLRRTAFRTISVCHIQKLAL